MPIEPWGATFAPTLALPNRGLGYFLLSLYIILFLWAMVFYRRKWRQVSRRELFLTLSFCFAAGFASQLLLLELPADNILPPIAIAEAPVNILRLFGYVPILLAALVLSPELVIFVGLASGLGRAMWQTHQVFDLFHFALAAWLTARWLRQNYLGWGYRLLRIPPLAAMASMVLVLPLLVALATYIYAPESASILAAIDLSFSTARAQIVTALLEGLVSGLIVSVILWGVPHLHEPPAVLEPSPFSSTLNRRLLSGFIVYSAFLFLSLPTVVSNMSINVATDLVIGQMEQDALTVSGRLPTFLRSRENLLIRYQTNEDLLSGNEEEQQEALTQLYQTLPFFRQVALVQVSESTSGEAEDSEPEYQFEIMGVAPAPGTTETAANVISISNFEAAAILRAVRTGGPATSEAHRVDDIKSDITIAVPLQPTEIEEGISLVLIGRVADLSLRELIDNLSDETGNNRGFIVDDEGQIIAHPEESSLLTEWSADDVAADRILFESAETGGTAYVGIDGQSNTRLLVYYLRNAERDWTVVITTPYEVVLDLAWRTWQPVISVLAAATVLFLVVLAWIGTSVSRPMTALSYASERIASGDYTTALDITGNDEVGRLGRAFTQMQRALRNRMEELSLLLNVSQNVSGSLNISEGLPSILRAALRGTGAAGARMVVMNPNGRYPLTFGEGPADEVMSLYDRQIMSMLREDREMVFSDPESMQPYLNLEGLDSSRMSFKAMIAFALFSHNRFQGVFWLVYRQPHQFLQTELDLLRTLAGQAAVLMENARLFATADGGRRRLLAVLASTNDAVIVTDPTNRVLLINPAMERAFGLKIGDVKNRQLNDALQNHQGVVDLLNGRTETDMIQIAVGDKTFSASASTIVSTDGQAQGRVAVLHDVTHMKELDEMKSNFVQMVSHDLRSPLTYMNGFMAMLPMVGELNDKQVEYVEKVQNGIEQLNTMVKNLLDLGRLEAGLELMKSPLRLDSLLQSVSSDLKPIAEENGVELVVETPVKLPYLNLDNALVRQAIVNLVNNAIKYAPQSGRVTIRAEIVPASNGSQPQQEVVISVADNGPGIPQEELPRLFEKFHRVQQRSNIKIKGSGLGLAIVKLVAERHGGRAWVDSELDVGSTFYIAFPHEPVDFNLM